MTGLLIPYGEARFIGEHRDRMPEFLNEVESLRAKLRDVQRVLNTVDHYSLTPANALANIAAILEGKFPA